MNIDSYVLIVDDEQNIINAIQRQLRSIGYNCFGTTSGKVAIDKLQEDEAAVLICDQKMPDMSGPEVLKMAFEVSPNTQRITITGYADINMAVEAINIGRTSRFIFKPFERSNLIAVVNDCYNQYRLIKENDELIKLKEVQNIKIVELSERLIDYTRNQKNIFKNSWLLQSSLLLGTPPTGLKDIQISSKTLPAHTLDGDFVFFHKFSQSVFDLVIGDVMGKGLFAALTAASLRGYFMREWGRAEGLGFESHTPADIIRCLSASVEERMVKFDIFVSLFYARIDLNAKTMRYVDAGGVKPLMFKAKMQNVNIIEGNNCPIGIPEGGNFITQEEVTFDDNDVILFYSDGVVEESNKLTGKFFGQKRIETCLIKSSKYDSHIIISNLFKEVAKFRQEGSQSDDLTCVALKFGDFDSCMLDRNNLIGNSIKEFEMKSSYNELDRLHELLNKFIVSSQLFLNNKEKADSVILAVHEAFVNIIKHSYNGDQTKPVWIDITCNSEYIKVSLYDYGITFDRDSCLKVDFSGKKTHGYGLYLINEIASNVIYSVDNNARNLLQLIFKLK